jgi:solute carrier family 25 (mitochondrial phosphate transporter), member 3
MLFPRLDTLQQSFGSPYPFTQQRNTPKASGATPLEARMELYQAYSVVDDAKGTAKKLSAEATKEFEAASRKAQAAAGGIELYSPKYYAACTFGGMLACVSRRFELSAGSGLTGHGCRD